MMALGFPHRHDLQISAADSQGQIHTSPFNVGRPLTLCVIFGVSIQSGARRQK